MMTFLYLSSKYNILKHDNYMRAGRIINDYFHLTINAV